ncbi:uncharacterized protein LOC123309764 isoform X2 [Coccinella septempunctata]|nr:uncharacterized protein LOC123309764 isoform X2 [Coccinella septempunctata]XP_044748951.1 uncharacterized protein LOC123309764 isoform X2 [Coccinella septempunctata]
MDYDQWKPLGRGDPLKNDPTYDYVPPVLDRVHYWIDPSSRKPDAAPSENHKTEILLLGVSSKKPSTGSYSADSRKDVYDSFMKFVDGPKLNNHQRMSRPQFNTDFYHTFNRKQFSERNAYSKGNEQRIPYTILVPPPLSFNKPSTSQPLPLTTFSDVVFSSSPRPSDSSNGPSTSAAFTSPPHLKDHQSTSSDITIQPSNLIYSSSSYSSPEEWNKPVTEITRYKSTWKTTPPSNSQHSNRNQINNDYKDIVFAEKPSPESFIQVDFSLPSLNYSHNPLLEAGSDHNINFIAAPSFGSNVEIMHKGEVSDDNLDISNTYVKIGKTEAQVHASDDVASSIIAQPISAPDMDNMKVFSHIEHPMQPDILTYTPLTLQTIQDMQTMQPPPITMSPIFTKPSSPMIIPKREKHEDSNEVIPTKTTEFKSQSSDRMNVETTTEFITTTSTALTTDPLFKHYKQPLEPMSGPLYLIIQGHSKVKTYGASKAIHGIAIQETNEISDGREGKKNYEVEHLHHYPPKMEEDKKFRHGRSETLQTLKHVVETGLGAIKTSDFQDGETDVDRADTQETELQSGFEVSSGSVSEEKYHKGIVEAARKLKNFNGNRKL